LMQSVNLQILQNSGRAGGEENLRIHWMHKGDELALVPQITGREAVPEEAFVDHLASNRDAMVIPLDSGLHKLVLDHLGNQRPAEAFQTLTERFKGLIREQPSDPGEREMQLSQAEVLVHSDDEEPFSILSLPGASSREKIRAFLNEEGKYAYSGRLRYQRTSESAYRLLPPYASMKPAIDALLEKSPRRNEWQLLTRVNAPEIHDEFFLLLANFPESKIMNRWKAYLQTVFGLEALRRREQGQASPADLKRIEALQQAAETLRGLGTREDLDLAKRIGARLRDDSP